jgi:hypothetical protein
VSLVIVLGDQADEGSYDAPVRGMESDRRLDGREVVVEAPRIEDKDLEKEFESIASESLSFIVVRVARHSLSPSIR